MAMAAYLPGVALIWLALKDRREVRLIRFHSYQAIALWIWWLAILAIGSLLSSLLGGLPELGFWLNVLVGLVFFVALPGLFALGVAGALQAFQGSYASWPILSAWAWARTEGTIAPRTPASRKRPRRKKASAP